MAQIYYQVKQAKGQQQAPILLVVPAEQQKQKHGRRMSSLMNAQRRLSILSQLSLPHGTEYHPQRRLPPYGLESKQNVLLTRVSVTDKNKKQLHAKLTKKTLSSQNSFHSNPCSVADNGQIYDCDMKKLVI